jgi:hypothetical protein
MAIECAATGFMHAPSRVNSHIGDTANVAQIERP